MHHLKALACLTVMGIVIVNCMADTKPFGWLSSISSLFKREQAEWAKYKEQFGKFYSHLATDRKHMKEFIKNKISILKHNELYKQGKVTFKRAMNRFTDMTPEELGMRLMKPQPSYHPRITLKSRALDIDTDEVTTQGPQTEREKSAHEAFLAFLALYDAATANGTDLSVIPDAIDWRERGYVTSVKDQGKCASCWAFSGAGALEAANMRATNKLVDLSMQNLVDCMHDYGNTCEGGSARQVFRYAIANGGIDTDSSYPYTAKEGPCKFSRDNIGGKASSWMLLPTEDEAYLTFAVGTQGPVSVLFYADTDFHTYSSGVYTNPTCKTDVMDLNHVMLVVGYGTDPKDGDYWIVKNSWGTDWGIKGYALIARNANNMCGIATDSSYPVLTA